MRMIFVNLPVKDLDVTRAFWATLGFSFNEQFSDHTAACLVIDDNIFAMLITEGRFRDFINGYIADAHTSTEVLTCLSFESREEVDRLLATALDAGAKPWKPTTNTGGMYGGSFQDPDGHVWKLMAMPQQ